MREELNISIDVMGGDHGPEVTIPALDLALMRHPGIRFCLFGIEDDIRPWLEKYPNVAAVSDLTHCDVSIGMDEKPSQALRRGRRKSSMWLAIQAVKEGRADVGISAGNTGALMAMSTFILRTLEGIDRPALAALWPTLKGESIVLDVGATIGAQTMHLVDLAVMGAAMARAVFGQPKPTVGLLNIGVEEVKGLEPVKQAGQILKSLDLKFTYHGFVEGNDLGKGTVDVVVTEGFSGNIALKTAEGTAWQVAEYLRLAISRSWLSKLGYILARSAFRALREKLDPRRSNGGVFLGLNGIVIKSHGGTDPVGFASAIDLAIDMARFHLPDKIARDIDTSHKKSIQSSKDDAIAANASVKPPAVKKA